MTHGSSGASGSEDAGRSLVSIGTSAVKLRPAKLFWNATGATLSDNLMEIVNELSNLRVVS